MLCACRGVLRKQAHLEEGCAAVGVGVSSTVPSRNTTRMSFSVWYVCNTAPAQGARYAGQTHFYGNNVTRALCIEWQRLHSAVSLLNQGLIQWTSSPVKLHYTSLQPQQNLHGVTH